MSESVSRERQHCIGKEGYEVENVVLIDDSKAKEDDMVYVIACHSHYDKWNHCESTSNVLDVYRNPISAYLLCIKSNLEKNEWNSDDCRSCDEWTETAVNLYGEKLAYYDHALLLDFIMNLDKLEDIMKIYDEVLEIIDSEPVDNVQATADVYKVHVKVIL